MSYNEETDTYDGYDYDGIFMGKEIVIKDQDNDYQGDIRYILKDGDKYGYCNVGFGSCNVARRKKITKN